MSVDPSFRSVYSYLDRWETFKTPAYHQLLSERNKERSVSFLSGIPASASTLWGYEFRLANVDLETDFQICVSHISYRSFYNYLSETCYNHPLWKSFLNLTARWIDGRDPVSVLVRNLWLEMDAPQMRSYEPVPNFFLGPADGLSTPDFTKVISYVFSVLGITLKPDEQASISNIHGSLPNGAWIPQVGMMAARPGDQQVRLFVHNISQDAIYPFLLNAGYVFEEEGITALLNEMHQLFDFVDMNVETQSAARRNVVGFEGYVRKWEKDRLEKVLAYLLSSQVMDIRYSDKIASFFEISSQQKSLYTEFIHHFKITYSGSGGMEAKLYIGIKRNNLWERT